MGLYEHFPYLNFHDLNLDWILSTVRSLEAKVNGLQLDIRQYVYDWLNAHPEATTTVLDGAITRPKLNASLDSEITFRNDINKEFTPDNVKLGAFSGNGSAQIQGMATDGTYLYIAGTDGDTTHPVIYVIDPVTLSKVGEHTLQCYGHPNSMDYCDGHLLIAGTMPSAANTTYRYITIVDISDWSETTIQLTGGTQWWSAALLRAYNGKYVLAGHRASTGVIDLFATIYNLTGTTLGEDKFLPWRELDISAFSCDPAGMSQYGNFILIGDAHLGTSLAKNCVRVFTSNGDFKGNIYLPSMGSKELEDICVIGTEMYIVDIEGTIYRASLGQILQTNYDSGMFQNNDNAGIQFVYINENGGEAYTDYGTGDNAHILTSFRTVPWYFPSKHWITGGSMQVRNATDTIILNAEYEANGKIVFCGSGKSGTALVSYYFRYARSSDADEYIYTLETFGCTSHYGGTETYYSDMDTAADAGYLDGYSYVRDLIAEACPQYTTSQLVL